VIILKVSLYFEIVLIYVKNTNYVPYVTRCAAKNPWMAILTEKLASITPNMLTSKLALLTLNH